MSGARTGGRRHPTLAAIAMALVLLAACGGDGDSDSDEASGTTRPAVTSTTAVGGGPPVAAGSPTTTSSPDGPAGSAGAGPAAGKSLPPTTTARPAGARAPASTAPAAPAVAATPPGRYRYASTGTFSAGVTGEQARTGESILTVDPPMGADQHSLRQGDSRSSEQVVRFQADGIYIVMLKVTEQGLTKEFRPPAPVLAFPYRAAVGRTWSWRMTSTDGKTTVESDFRIDRTETVPVGAESVPAVVVQANLVTSGDVVSRGTQAFWVNEARRLVVREESRTNGTFGAISFRSTAEERLLNLSPA